MADKLTAIVSSAEREIGSFYRAVLQSYGPEQARAAVWDWLNIIETLEMLPENTVQYWRRVTILASDRLATRICTMHARELAAESLLTI